MPVKSLDLRRSEVETDQAGPVMILIHHLRVSDIMKASLKDLNCNFCELYLLRLGVSGGEPGPGALCEFARQKG